MAIITVKNLKRYYRAHRKEPGLKGSLKSLWKKKYQTIKAVNGISFSIEPGELIGFIGPNGAGKTTALKCMSGLLYPTAGNVEVIGYNPWDRQHQYLKMISLVMGQKNQLWWDLPPMESFILNKEIYEIADDKFKQILGELTELLDLKDILGIQVRKLSLGQRMKCELVAALLHSPRVLFLDEPTIGLDVVMQKNMRDFIKTYNERYGSTIILTSHYMGDVAELCQRLIIIDKGIIVFDGKLMEITRRFADHKIIRVVFAKQIDPKKLEKIAELKEYRFPKAVLKVKRSVISLAAAEILQTFPVADLNIEESPIEDIIRELFTGKDYS